MSNAGPAAGPPTNESIRRSKTNREPRHSSVYSGTHTSKNAATNVMLLTVSFYVIFTTLPATLVYVLANVFPEGRPMFHGACSDGVTMTQQTPTGVQEDPEVVIWHRYIVYKTVSKIVNEICLSHYACNFFFYVVTGKEFRSALRRLCRASVTETSHTAKNGSPRRGQSGRQHTQAGNEQRTLLARI